MDHNSEDVHHGHPRRGRCHTIQPHMHVSMAHRATDQAGQSAIHCLVHLIRYLAKAQLGGLRFICDSAEEHPPPSHIVSLLGPSSLFDAPKCGLGAYRNTRVCQNLLPYLELNEAHARIPAQHWPMETAIAALGLANWITHSSPPLEGGKRAPPNKQGFSLHGTPPRLGTHSNSLQF